MAKAGHVNHWKHGWIPIDATALAASRKQHPALALSTGVAAEPQVHSKISRGQRWTTVDGCPDVKIKEVEELPARSPSEYADVARTAQKVISAYPRATVDENGDPWPLTIGFSSELPADVMADTGAWEFDKIRLNTSMWDKPAETESFIADVRKRNWGVFGQASDLASFRRSVLTHEIGHVLQARDERANKNNGEFTTSTVSKGEIDKFTDEKVTPREAGWTTVDKDNPTPDNLPQPSNPVIELDILDQPTARWQVDSLNKQSVYALTNKYEFWAEAFLDGTINGDKATATGKRAVAVAKQVFGPKGAA